MTGLLRLDRSCIWLIVTGTGALLSVVWPSVAGIVGITIFIGYAVQYLLLRSKLYRTPANLSLLVLFCLVLVNPLVSVRPHVSFPVTMQTLIGISLVFAVSNWALDAQRLHTAMVVLTVTGLLLVIVAPFTVDWITDKYGFFPSMLYHRFLPLSQKLIHPNIIAGGAAVLFVTLTTYLRFAWPALRNAERAAIGAVSFSLIMLIAATQSRGALVATTVGSGAMVMLSMPRRWVILLTSLGLLLLLVIPNLLSVNLGVLLDSSASIRGATGRREIWLHALAVITDFPITGIGFHNFPVITDIFYPFLVANANQSHAHNLFLQIAVDMGLTGLVAWLSCLILVFSSCVNGIQSLHDTDQPVLMGVCTGLFCGQVTMLLHGLTDAPLWTTRPSLLIWVLWGMALALPACLVRKSILGSGVTDP
jgi:putative inorganic carbon (hco3(-)) transporter